MTRTRSSRFIIAVLIAVLLMVPAAVASAQTGPAVPPPIAIKGPRLAPPAIPHSSVLDPYVIYNNLLVPPGLPAQSLEADAADGGRAQEKPGRGIRQTATGIGFGLLLYDTPNVCNNFDPGGDWASLTTNTDIWTDWFGGWAPFAIDNGYYQAKNVTFSRERSVGPGNTYVHAEKNMATAQHSAKIASNQPYAAGFGSPIIPVPEGFEGGKALVTVKYLIWDHDTGGGMGDGWDYDWASLGVKPGAAGDTAVYVNGYVRGEWAEMTNTIELGEAKDIMVLLQGHSPGAFNSNIYFDDVQIAFIDAQGNGAYLKDCKLAESVK
ncbi:MAG: hypothetical protein QM346_01235 [Chloroflexota bacterium]|nr:hypothetical protein [Chloroflexota bacterium]